MEIIVDAVKGKHMVDLLIVHRLKYFISIYQCYNHLNYYILVRGLARFYRKKKQLNISDGVISLF